MRLLRSRRALFIFALLLLVFSLWASRKTANSTAFSLRGTTDFVSVEPFCGQQLIWDFDEGRVAGLPSSADQDKVVRRGVISVQLRGGSRASVERLVDGSWRVRIGAGTLGGTCPAQRSDAAFGITVDDQPFLARASDFVIAVGEGAKPEDPAPTTGLTLLLAGRVVLGEKIQHGGGWAKASAPALHQGDLQARIKDGFTQRSIPILEEKLDPGSRVDTHACLDQPAGDALLACLQRNDVRATGFVRASRDGALDVQLHVTTNSIGIEPHGGTQRAVAVTWWSALIASPFIQMLAASLVLFSAVLQAGNAMTDWLAVRSTNKKR